MLYYAALQQPSAVALALKAAGFAFELLTLNFQLLTACKQKKREPTSPPHVSENRRNQLFMAGVRDPRQDVAPAVRHAGTRELRAFRRPPLPHRRADCPRPLVYAFGILRVTPPPA